MLSSDSLRYFIFFFFQAEDGIRDYKVTGVQTCALPISSAISRSTGFGTATAAAGSPPSPRRCQGCGAAFSSTSSSTSARSEEHTSELQSPCNLVCRLLLEKKKNQTSSRTVSMTYT